MRILKVRFKNLNSLVGEWAIDFRDPAFEDAGIFAIVGPTGAGKTTLFDAICLALFAETPRLGAITKADNGILSRQAAECFSEVTFETRDGIFVSHFSQKRAHGKLDGALQQPKREVSRQDGKVEATKTTDVSALIESVTGMDFDRFTRSMLLAQGQFAAFIQARASERGAILEQMTGTEIYGDLSVAAFQKSKQESDRLNQMLSEGNAIELLSIEQRTNAEQELAALVGHLKTLTDHLETLRREERWLTRLHELELDIQTTDTEWRAAQEALEAFAPEKQRLQLDEAARALRPVYEDWTLRRNELQREEERLQLLRTEAVALESAERDAHGRVVKAQEAMLAIKQQISQAEPHLRRARDLDLLLRQSQIALRDIEAADQGNREATLQLATREDRLKAEEDRVRSLLCQHQAVLQANAQDEGLDRALSGILQSLEERDRRMKSVEKLQQVQARTRSLIADLEVEASQAASVTGDHSTQERTISLRMQEVVTALGRIQGNDSPESLHQESARLQAAMEHATQVRARWLRIAQIDQQLLEQQQEAAAATVEKDQAVHEHDRVVLAHSNARDRLIEEERRSQLAQRVMSFEAAREELAPDTPCPLCGALDHPYSATGQGKPAADPHSLEAARQDLQGLEQSLKAAIARRATWISKVESIQSEIHKSRSRRDAEAAALGTPGDAMIEGPATALATLEAEILALQAALHQIRHQQSEIHLLERKRDELRHDIDRLKEESHQASLRHQSTQQRLAGAIADLTRIDREEEEARSALEHTEASLSSKLQPFSMALGEDAPPGTLREILTAKRDNFGAAQEKCAALTMELERLSTEAKLVLLHKTTLEEKRVEISDKLARSQQEQEALSAERAQLLRGSDADTFSSQLQSALVLAEANHEKAAGELTEVRRRSTENAATKRACEDSKSRASSALASAETSWVRERTRSAFSTDDAYAAALLDDEVRAGLLLAEKARGEALQRLTLRKEDRLAEWTRHRQVVLSERVPETVRDDIARFDEDRTNTLHAFGSLKERLDSDDRRRQEALAHSSQVEAQRLVHSRWLKLKSLIGSADGKAFREFAQTLTFERVIDLANSQLRHMSDRYQLVRSKSSKDHLDLDVMDHYQASEVRPIKNLSGGETFLVSLALALGLSQMSSRRVRVDSLFLDEGFGTLDEETLEIALDALSSLRHEGKMIGVISHVPALKDRIATRIEVRPNGLGSAVLVGPGCSRG